MGKSRVIECPPSGKDPRESEKVGNCQEELFKHEKSQDLLKSISIKLESIYSEIAISYRGQSKKFSW
jgi:hypothetical protein